MVSWVIGSHDSGRLFSIVASRSGSPGSRLQPQRSHTVTLVAACLANGLSAVIVDPDSAGEEVSHLVDLVSPRAAIVDRDLVEAWDLSSVSTVLAISHELQKGGALIRRLMGSTPAR